LTAVKSGGRLFLFRRIGTNCDSFPEITEKQDKTLKK
jgi:hypothetical protein